MKFYGIELQFPPTGRNSTNRLFFSALTLILLTSVPLCLWNWGPPLPFPKIDMSNLRKSKEQGKKCDIFTGQWVPHPEGPYYTTDTCHLIIDQHNCIKLGRPDTEFMKWRWKPDDCELPYFDAVQFLELVRGKSMAFLGDSVGLNQMQSLVCLLADVATAEYVSHQYSSNIDYSKHWFYADYNFSLATLWSPYLVKYRDVDPKGYSRDSLMNLYLDEADEKWAGEIENYDYVIISAGQWFSRPLYFYEKGQLVGCQRCPENNITIISKYHAYKMAFRTAFRTLLSLNSYKGFTFLRTFSASHFENGTWDEGGNCIRTRPFTRKELKLEDRQLYLIQMQEVRAVEEEWSRGDLKFGLLNTTKIMWLRPDGHPGHFGRSPHKNMTVNDCVHWCLPGPIDTWNELLLYLMKSESLTDTKGKLMKNP